jgi:hypothetical protein
MTAAIAGYWGALEALVSFCRGRIRTGDANTVAERLWRRVRGARRQAALPAIAMALCLVFLPGLFTRFGISFNAAHAKFAATYWNEPWPDQPELRDFLAGKIGLGTDRRFRGSAYFFTGGADEFRTLGSLWVDRVPTVNEYSQLVSPQSVYLFNALFKDRVNYQLNWFPRWMGSGASDPLLFRTLGALGARYIAGYDRVPEVETAQLGEFNCAIALHLMRLPGRGIESTSRFARSIQFQTKCAPSSIHACAQAVAPNSVWRRLSVVRCAWTIRGPIYRHAAPLS